MTKLDIALQIAKELDMNQTVARRVVQMILDELTNIVVTEGRLELRYFGVFEVQKRKPRKARNPRTGATVMIPARNVITFKPGLTMQERVNRQSPTIALDESSVTDA